MNDLPEGWRLKQMGDVARVVSGATPRTTEPSYWGGDIAWITPDDLSRHSGMYVDRGARSLTAKGYEACSATLMPAGAVLFSSRAPIGYVAVASGPVCTNQGFKSFVPGEEVTSEYLYWYLRHLTPEIREMGSGTTFLEISKKVAENIPVVVPPLEVQHRIVEMLEDLFSRLEVGVGLVGSAAGRLAPLESSSLSRAFSQFKERRALHECCDAARPICYGILKPRTSEPSTVPYIEVRSIRGGRIDPQHILRTSQRLHNEFKRSELRPGDVVLAIRGSYDRAAVVPTELDGANISRDVARIAPGPGLLPRFLVHYLHSPEALGFFRRHARGVGVTGINIGDLRQLPIPVAEPEDQAAVVNHLDGIDARVISTVSELHRLRMLGTALRSSILSAAFSGRLTLQEAVSV